MSLDRRAGAPAAPLAGVRVVDFSRLLPGAFCTLLLSDLGAEVIKVEHPRGGDGLRGAAPFTHTGESGAHVVLDRGKRSITLDLKSDDGVRIARALIGTGDVVVESFRPGTFDRLGLGWTWSSEHAPRVVLASISAYGASGPESTRSGHDLNALAVAGVLSLTGSPSPTGGQSADVLSGALAAVGIVAALREREQTGTGRHVDAALADAASATVVLAAAQYRASGHAPAPGGPLVGGLACYGTYACADGRHLAVGALEPVLFTRVCAVLGRPDLADSQYDPTAQSDLRQVLAEQFGTRSRDAWVEQFAGVDAAVTPVLDVGEAWARVESSGRTVVPADLVDGTEIAVPGDFVHLLGAGSRPATAAPALGGDTVAVLAELGYSSADVERLRRDEVL